jgi:lipopolysaccharide biosynthesis protein
LVITSPVSLSEETQRNICDSVRSEVEILIFRPNHGFDFYSWKRGIAHASKVFGIRPTEVLLTNDSILGPLFNLSADVEWLKKSDQTLQLKGLTQSDEIAPHIQSYFLYFNQILCSKGILDLWLQRIKAYRTKEDVIGFYEVGGSQHLQKRGVALLARYPLAEKRNPTLYAWKELIQSHRFPFFKKSLLTFHQNFLNKSELASVLAELVRDSQVNQEALKQIQAEIEKNSGKL